MSETGDRARAKVGSSVCPDCGNAPFEPEDCGHIGWSEFHAAIRLARAEGAVEDLKGARAHLLLFSWGPYDPIGQLDALIVEAQAELTAAREAISNEGGAAV